MKDFYYILGTPSNCSQSEISEAYSKLSKKLKPASDERDYFLEGHFREISDAYEILSDPLKRSTYDAALKKSHKKQLSNFKIKLINIAVTCSFILFTAIFGFYVIKSIRGNKVVKVVVDTKPVTPYVYKAKHYKKKRSAKVIQPSLQKHVVLNKDTIQPPSVKPVAITTNQPPVIQPPVVTQADSSYTTSLKANLSGLIYLHQLADYMSAVVTVLPKQCKVRVLDKGPSFYKVTFNNQVGYIPKWTLVKP